MKEMKTITINSVTYTVTDPDAATIDDSAVGGAAWSGKNTVDKLCPSFSQGGYIVTCEPVEGYPLEVEWSRKNLCPLGTRTFTTYAEYSLDTAIPAGTYYFSALVETTDTENTQVLVTFYSADGTAEKTYCFITPTAGVRSGNKFTLTEPTSKIRLYASAVWNESQGDTATFTDIQIEKGTTATAYEPYAETASITRCGKNLFDKSESKMKVVSWLTPEGTQSKEYYGFEILLPPGSYVLKAYPASTDNEGYLYGVITTIDGTRIESWTPVYGSRLDEHPKTFTDWVKIIFYEASIPLENGAYKPTSMILFNRFNIQLEVGNTATAYEPYKGETFPMTDREDGTPVATVPALAGVNTLWVDDGELTVTGRNDPSAIIRDLYDKINTLQANAVDNV